MALAPAKHMHREQSKTGQPRTQIFGRTGFPRRPLRYTEQAQRQREAISSKKSSVRAAPKPTALVEARNRIRPTHTAGPDGQRPSPIVRFRRLGATRATVVDSAWGFLRTGFNTLLPRLQRPYFAVPSTPRRPSRESRDKAQRVLRLNARGCGRMPPPNQQFKASEGSKRVLPHASVRASAV
jgi:hypothetical protein